MKIKMLINMLTFQAYNCVPHSQFAVELSKRTALSSDIVTVSNVT